MGRSFAASKTRTKLFAGNEKSDMRRRTTAVATLRRSRIVSTVVPARTVFGSQTPAAASALWMTWLQLFVRAFHW